MRRWIAGLMVCLLLTAACGAALAGKGDRAVAVLSTADSSYSNGSLTNVIRMDQKLYLFIEGLSSELRVLDLDSGETEHFDMQEMMDRMNGLSENSSEEAAERDAEEDEEDEEEDEDEDEDEEESSLRISESVLCWFPWKGELYALTSRSLYGQNQNRVDGGHVKKVILQDGKADLAKEDTVKLDWEGMTFMYGSYEENRQTSSSAADDKYLYLSTYDFDGNQAMEYFDLETGEMREQSIPNLSDIGSDGNGKLLVSQEIWGDHAEKVISRFDPETEELEELYRFNLDEGSVSNIAADPETGMLYFVRAGEIYAAPDGQISQATPVNDCPVSSQPFAQLMPNGQMLVWAYFGAFLRNTDPALRSSVSLRIRPFSWTQAMDTATFDFTAEHSDIAVIKEENGDESTLLQAMMNRDSKVDIYVMNMDSNVFSALYDRGFLMDLSGSKVLTEFAGKLYPFAQEALSRDGSLVAVPVDLDGSTLGYKREGLEAAGLTEADLPKTWKELPDFLAKLPSLLEGRKVRAFNIFTEKSEVKNMLVRMLLAQYALARPGEPVNTPEMRELLDRLQKVDYEAVGLMTPEEIEVAFSNYEEMGGNNPHLFDPYCQIPLESYFSDSQALTLTLDGMESPVLPLSMTVAFVNPFTEHPEEAMAYLESLCGHLETATLYTLDPGKNEPMRAPNHEEQKKNLEKWLKIAQQNMEKEEDEDEQADWEEIIKTYQEMLDKYDEENWLISPKGIALYRERAEYIRPERWNYFSVLSTASEGADQFQETLQGYMEGTRSGGDLLSLIDKKVQMMRLEGN